MILQKRFIFFLFLILTVSVLALSGAYGFLVKALGLRSGEYSNRFSVLKGNSLPTSTPSLTPTATLTPTPTPIPIGLPNLIEIPKISISANIIALGVTPTNIMEVPRDATTVGWYTDSPRPGEKGIALINGHYDTTTGKPAIFYELKKLSAGDEILVYTAKNEKLIFKVEKVSSESFESFPDEVIYGKSEDKELRLITCSGVWNRALQTYSDRLIVFARLYEEIKV